MMMLMMVMKRNTLLFFSATIVLIAFCALSRVDATCGVPSSCPAPCKYFPADDPPSKDQVPHCNAKDQGGPCAGMAGHCCNISQMLWKTCKTNGWGSDVWVATEYPAIDSCCWCACQCSCFQRGTGVHGIVNDTVGFFPIENFAKDDLLSVLAEKPSAKPLVWEDSPIIYSAGTREGAVNTVVVVIYKNGDTEASLISTPEQLYLVNVQDTITDNALVLVRADQLNPSVHKLVGYQGNAIDITQVSEGSSSKGVWHVSTSDEDTNPQSHLLNVQGIIAADFFLCTQNVTSFKWDIPIATNYPRINSLAHFKANPRPETASNVDIFGVTSFDVTAAAQYEPPRNAKSFIPTWMGLVQSEMVPLNTTSRAFTLELLALYGAFNPQINFAFIEESPIVNAFTYRTSNSITVELHGGLVRQVMMGWEGLAFIIGRQVASVEGGPPYYNNGTREYSCEAVADYMGMTFLRGVFLNPSGPLQFVGKATSGALYQIQAFFESLPSKGQATPAACAHPQGSINIACRMEIIKAGGSFLNMPDCWNKPVNSKPNASKKAKKDEL